MAAFAPDDRDLNFNVLALALDEPNPSVFRVARRALDDLREYVSTLERTVAALVTEED